MLVTACCASVLVEDEDGIFERSNLLTTVVGILHLPSVALLLSSDCVEPASYSDALIPGV
jgi:hypothetical protein